MNRKSLLSTIPLILILATTGCLGDKVSKDVSSEVATSSTQITTTKRSPQLQYLETFKIEKCHTITLEYYPKMSDRTPSRTETISNVDEIGKILALLNKLPEEGAKMKKMGDVPILRASMYLDGKGIGSFTYYREMLKLVDTSFATERSDEEAELYRLLKKKLRI